MKRLLIMKTGLTILPLRDMGEDFEDWIILRSGKERSAFIVVSVFRSEILPTLDSVAGIIVTGSPAYVTDHEPWSEEAAQYLRQAVALKIPVLGICYGHQLLAYGMGGEVDFNPHGRDIGTVTAELTGDAKNDALFGKYNTDFKCHVSHLQSVTRMPSGTVLLAVNKVEPNLAFRLGDSAWGVQFHPEFSKSVTAAYIKERRAAITDEGQDPEALLAGLDDTPEASQLLKNFADFAMPSSTG